jgi:hypothetical protein
MRVLDHLLTGEDGMAERAARNRDQAKRAITAILLGHGEAGDTRGSAPGSKWCAANAIAEYAHFGRRYTKRSNQVQRSFEDTQPKERGLELRSPTNSPLEERAEEIKRRYDALPDDGYGYKPGSSLHAEEDAARAYGCLLEFKQDGHYGGQAFVCAPSSSTTAALPCPARANGAARPRALRA